MSIILVVRSQITSPLVVVTFYSGLALLIILRLAWSFLKQLVCRLAMQIDHLWIDAMGC